jgi:endonuclease G, mitochondrial
MVKFALPINALLFLTLVLTGCSSQGRGPQVPQKVERPLGQAKRATVSTVGRYSQTFTYAGNPSPKAYPYPITILRNSAYLVGYDESRQNPAWVAYRIPAQTIPGDFPRPKRFLTDPRTIARVTHDDYTGTGYDRGHMAPNLAIASRFGEKAQIETFLMSNVVPQKPVLNQGPWRLLEETLANVTAPAAGEIWVVTGPIYDGHPEYIRAGNEIPDAFFMAIADETQNGPKLQAFILAQGTPRKADFRSYRTTIDKVEQATGLNLFTELPDTQEEELESATAPYWLESLK